MAKRLLIWGSAAILLAFVAGSGCATGTHSSEDAGASSGDDEGEVAAYDGNTEQPREKQEPARTHIEVWRVDAAIRTRWGEFVDCFAKANPEDLPDHEITFVTEFVIGSAGKATSVNFTYRTVKVPEIESCLLETIKKVDFPPPDPGEEALGNQTFLLIRINSARSPNEFLMG